MCVVESPRRGLSISQAQMMLGDTFTYVAEGVNSACYESTNKSIVIKIQSTADEIMQKYQALTGQGVKTNYYFAEEAKKGDKKALAAANDDTLAAEYFIARDEKSYQLAWEKLKDKAVLLFLHLKPDDEEDSPFDKIKIKISSKSRKMLDFSKVSTKTWYLQKKVTTIKDYIAKLDSKVQVEGVRKAIDQWLALQEELWSVGITDSDIYSVQNNYGYDAEGNLRIIDIGALSADPSIMKFQLEGQYATRPEMSFRQFIAEYQQQDYLDERVRAVYGKALLAFNKEAKG